nr:MAG TPA: hypothetical protein [Caudoviricetes sp.]
MRQEWQRWSELPVLQQVAFQKRSGRRKKKAGRST